MQTCLRCFYILLIFTASSKQSVLAQRSADNWINPAQTYFKIPTVQNGMYRLKAEDLKKAGLPGNVNPQAFQLFHRGEEVSIFVQGEADGAFDTGDYVEFYGTRNDGTLDSALYFPRPAQPHRFYNLYSDTTAYFLTWRADGSKGRRMAAYQETNGQNLPPEPYYWVTNRQVYTGDFSAGTFHPLGLRNWSASFFTHYDWGEAYTGGAYKSGQTGRFGFDLAFIKKDAGVLPEIEYQLLGRNPDPHTILATAGPQPGQQRPVDTLNLDGFRHQTYRATVAVGDVAANGELHFNLTARDPLPATPEVLGVLPWTFCPTYIQVRYPAQPVLFAPQLEIEPRLNPADRSYFDISNVAEGSVLYDLTDARHPVRIGSGYVQAGAKLQAVVRQTSQPRRLLLVSQFTAPLAIRPLRFRALPSKADFLLVSHEGLMKPATGYPDPVRAYAAYRASAAGGRHDTLVVTMQQLTDQFNYGEWSPVAIRNFAEAAHRRMGAQFLFLVGQSRWPHHMRQLANRYALDPVPNAGWPSADTPLVMGLGGPSPFVPIMPVGRLNAATPQQVADYLNKVKEHESAPASALWRKKILHLSGGKSPGELSLFKNYVDDFKRIAESGPVGVNVQTLSKKTDGPVEMINVAQQINEGVGMVTFFGHSGGDVTDIDIGFCSNDQLGYRNQGRYPLLLINGCEAGNLFYDGGQKTFATDWVNTPNRGAILALAHASSGYPGPLRAYSNQLYQVLFTDSTYAGKPFGTVLREAIHRLVSQPGASFYEIGHAQQVTLQGDPAVTLLPATKPDYAVDNAGLFLQATNQQNVVASADSFRMGVVLSNLGRVPRQAVQLSIRRTLSNGTMVDYGLQTLKPISYRDTLFFTLRNDKTNGGGPNRFEVVIDPDRQLDESSRDNNRATLDITIPGFPATPLFPPNFGVLNTTENGTPTATLTAQVTPVLTKNGKAISRNFLLEIDTTTAFNSSFKRSQTIAAEWLPSWKSTLLPTDSTTYYWRIREADLPVGASNGWAESSFTFLKDVPDGWAQATATQLARTTQEHIALKNGQWTLQTSVLRLRGRVAGADAGADAWRLSEVFLNDLPLVSSGNCFGDVLVAVAFQPVTLQPFSVLPAQQCGYSPFAANFFPDNALRDEALLQSYLDALPVNSYVLLLSAGKLNYRQWPGTVLRQLARLGADTTRLAALPTGSPYLLLGQLAKAKPFIERLPDLRSTSALTPAAQILVLESYDLADAYRRATVLSPVIGPALEWKQVFRKIARPNAVPERLDVLGVTMQGVETVLIENAEARQLSLQTVDAKTYPYLRLRLHVNSPAGSPVPQLRNWIVSYRGVPEGAIDPTKGVLESTVNIQEGEAFSREVTFQNISNRVFTDSLVVRQLVTNPGTGTRMLRETRVAPPPPGGSVVVKQTLETAGNAGENRLNVTFNPQVQPEQYFNNNSSEVLLDVQPDRANPLLEVIFDGRQIEDGELVSASPRIAIRLKDENKILVRKDTLGLDLRWQRPAGAGKWERLWFRNLTWSMLPDNDFRAEFHPQNLPDGPYALQVQGSDLSGNFAGGVPYLIHFQVKKSDMVSVVAYPNPLTAFTRFAVTVGGEQAPDAVRVQIYSPQGQLVRTLSAERLRVGVNELVWDASDANGLTLPDGVYLYKLTLTRPGLTPTEVAGKVVIVR